jgi:cellulose synthase operon protein C
MMARRIESGTTMNHGALRNIPWAAIVVSTALLVGCGSKDPASFVASAAAYVAKGNYPAAIIEAKNALQKAPDNGDARIVLATALLESGDAAGAEAEIRKAIALKGADDRTYPLLARALLSERQYKKLTDELADRSLAAPAARADLGVSVAAAWLAQRDIAHARPLLTTVLAEEPKNVRALLLDAQLAALGGDTAGAERSIGAALLAAPNSIDALMMKANLELAGGKSDEARKLLERAIAAHPDSPLPRYALIPIAVRAGKLDVAKDQLAKLKQLEPRDLRTSYAEAFVAAATGENARARDAIQRVLGAQPDNLPSLLLSGVIDFQLGSFGSAEETFTKVIAQAPDETDARRLLALIYLRKGIPAQALETLAPALRRNPDNALLLRTAGEAYLASGDAALAAGAYEHANAIDKGNVGSEVRLAQLRLAAGDTERAFSDLESLATSDTSNYQAELALVTEHVRRHEYDKALAAVDALEKKQPKSVLVPSLRGWVYLLKRDIPNARSNFERALQLKPDNLSAAQSLATLDILDGKPQLARERYERMLAKDPNNQPLQLARAEVMAVTGSPPDEVRTAIEKAVQASPASVKARMALINFKLSQRDPKAAVADAQAALATIPNDPQILNALATAQRAEGDFNQAIDTYRKLVALQPQNASLLLGLAEVQVAIKDYAGALDSERKALALKPDLAQAWIALMKTYVLSGQTEAAVAEARKLQKAEPHKAMGYALEGELLASQKKWPEAITTFRSALARQPLSSVAVREYAALNSAGRGTEAAALADKWMKDHPKDITFPLLLAETNQRSNALPAALKGYDRVLAIDPDNIVALNNAAWILATNKDARAIEYAERAHRASPLNANVLDTLGFALMQNGQSKRAVPLLRMASSIAPAQDQLRLHLAQALADTGDKAGARNELAQIVKSGKSSAVRDEAEKLQSTL